MKAKQGFKLRNICGEYIIVAEGESNIDFSNIISMNETSAYLWENIQGKELKPRALTWTERDALIKAGLDFVYCPVDVDDQVASIVRSRDIMRFILTDVYELTDEQLNTVSDKDAMNFAGEVITLTYQLQEETEKN